jgi:hypothetical protein
VAIRVTRLRHSVVHQPWWLNASTDGRYEEVTVEAGGKAVGRFPYVLDRGFGRVTFCCMPELTHFLGPAIVEGHGNSSSRVMRRRQITQALLEQLPKTTAFYQKMHAGIDDMLVFQKLNYDVSVQFTYEIHPSHEDVLWAHMRGKTRNVIRRGMDSFEPRRIGRPTGVFGPLPEGPV